MNLSLILNSTIPLRTLCPTAHPPIRQPKAQDLIRDQRRDIILLRSIGWQYKNIVTYTKATYSQVQRTCNTRATPVKRPGRPPLLTQAQIEELVDFVCASQTNRRMSYIQLANTLEFSVGRHTIRAALLREGFHRRLAMRKPPISPTNQRLRKAWAEEHVNWTMEQWYSILWTDETWITARQHTRTWVTRRPGEEWDPTCIVEKHQRKKGWMFWGCFHRHTQGPGIFWEKDWGKISSETYRQHTVPVIHRYIELMRR